MPTQERRRIFALGDWLTLAGMVLCAVGASLAWRRVIPPVVPLGGRQVIFQTQAAIPLNAFDLRMGPLSAGWAIMGCGLICAVLLLFAPPAAERKRFLALQAVLSLALVALTLLEGRSALLAAGPLLTIAGALALLWGAFLRYG